MTGATKKLDALETTVAPAVTCNGPLPAPWGTTTSNSVSETLVKSPKVGTLVLKATDVALLKPEPVTVMTLPGRPKVGEKPVMFTPDAASGKQSKSIPAFVRREFHRLLVFANRPNQLHITVAHKIAQSGQLQ